MAADVLMGNDPDCRRWIRPSASPTPDGEVGGRRVNRRRGGATAGSAERRRRRPLSATRRRSSSSRRRAGAAGSPAGTTVLDAARALGRRHRFGLRRARDLRPLPGDPGRRRVPQARDHLGAGAPVAVRGGRGRLPRRERASPPTGGCRARPSVLRRRRRSTSRPRARSTARSCARASTSATFTLDPVVRLHYVEVDAARARLADRRPRPAVRRARPRVGPARPRARTSRSSARSSRRSSKGDHRVTVAVHERSHVIAVWPGLHDRALRRRHRRRLDDHRRPPGEPGRRLGPRQRGRDEPADPLRRGPDEPGQLRDDAPTVRRDDAPRRPQGARRAARPARQSGRHQARRDPRARAGRQPDHASPRAGHRPDPARRRRRSRWPPTRAVDADRRGARPARPIRAPGSTCCRASPATSARTRPG